MGLVPTLLVAGAFLAGSIPFGVLFARARGVDIRAHGSGNIGATNVARVVGKRLGALVLLCDAAKGYLPVLAAERLLLGHCCSAAPGPHDAPLVVVAEPTWWVAAVGGAAFLGHLAPPWLRFRGGKGVATALGVYLAIAPWPSLTAVAVFALVYLLTRLSSLGSLLAATSFLPSLWIERAPRAYLALAAAMWLLIVVKHRGNIARLVQRTEHKV